MKTKVLLITHDYSLTGAPLALLNTARILKEEGYDVTVVGFKGGELTEKYKELGIKPLVRKYYRSGGFLFSLFARKFDFIFANTSLSCNCVETIYKKKPYIWRIAECNDIEEIFVKKFKKITNILSKVPKIHAVSQYTKEYLSKFNPNVDLLIYGVKDVSQEYSHLFDNYQKNEKIKFCCIGNLCERKGQKTIAEAYNLLSDDLKKQIEIHFVGKDYNDDFAELFKGQSNIIFHGAKRDKEKYTILAESDVLLCPSLDDPNPQVVMEAMMLKKPCIISDKVGQKYYLKNRQDGFIIEAGNSKELSNTIEKIINNKNILDTIKLNAHRIYQENFSENKYRERLLEVITELLRDNA